MWKAFKEFLNRGNMMDLAIGIVIGAAFNQVVNSLVKDILTPLIGVAMGGIDFSGQAFKFGAATITWGNFIMALINFLITAIALFIIVQIYNRFKRKEEKKEEVKKEAEPTKEVILLTQIRDLLQSGNANNGGTRRPEPVNPPKEPVQ
jgi:large conductance mechanosensitive channel